MSVKTRKLVKCMVQCSNYLYGSGIFVLMRPIILATFMVLLAVPIAIEPSASEKLTLCNTDKARKLAKFWNYDLNDAYKFGLKIQQYVEKKDLQSLFGLVRGELTYGPRKKSIQEKSFSEIFSNKWREEVLSEKPSCGPVGWRGFALAHGNIWYQQDSETNQWEIFSITGAKELEVSKNPLDGSWRHNGELLTFDCFTTIWLSGDNYEHYYDTFAKGKELDSGKFVKNIGQYIGGLVPIAPIARWAKAGSEEKLSLAVNLSGCLKKKNQTKIKMEDGWVSDNRCYPEGYCLVHKYRLIKQISLRNCKALAPHFSENCIALGLVQHSEATGGSIGNAVGEGIYGVIKDPTTKKVFVMPLVNFGSLNDALNYADQLEQ